MIWTTASYTCRQESIVLGINHQRLSRYSQLKFCSYNTRGMNHGRKRHRDSRYDVMQLDARANVRLRIHSNRGLAP